MKMVKTDKNSVHDELLDDKKSAHPKTTKKGHYQNEKKHCSPAAIIATSLLALQGPSCRRYQPVVEFGREQENSCGGGCRNRNTRSSNTKMEGTAGFYFAQRDFLKFV